MTDIFQNRYIRAYRVTESNQDVVATWCNGRVRGSALARADRIVQFNDHMEVEQDAKVGEWIIKFNLSRICIIAKNDQAQVLFNQTFA